MLSTYGMLINLSHSFRDHIIDNNLIKNIFYKNFINDYRSGFF